MADPNDIETEATPETCVEVCVSDAAHEEDDDEEDDDEEDDDEEDNFDRADAELRRSIAPAPSTPAAAPDPRTAWQNPPGGMKRRK